MDRAALRRRLTRISLEVASILAEIGGDDTGPEPAHAAVERLMRTCSERGVEVIDGTVGEADAARLIGRSASTLRRWRDEGSGPPSRRYLRRHRYAIDDLANFIAVSTENGSD